MRKVGVRLSGAIGLFVLALFFALPACGAEVKTESLRGPRIGELYMVVVRDPDAAVLALERGKLDVLGDVTRPSDIRRISKNTGFDLSMAQGFHMAQIGFNLRKSPWNAPELRRAAAMAIPRDRLVRELFSGYSAPLTTYLPPLSPYCDKAAAAPRFDPEGARALLGKAGWTWDSSGVLVPPKGKSPLPPATILSPTAGVAPTTAELADRIAGSLREIGIPVKAEPLDFAAMIQRIDEHKFDLYLMAWQLSRDPDSLYAFYHSSMDVKGGYNQTGLKDAKVDRLLEELRYAPDEPAARVAAKAAQKALADRLPIIPIYTRFSVAAVSKGWRGTVSTKSMTADNSWSLLAMSPASGPMRPLYWALGDEPRTLNPFTASTATDWQVLGMVYDTLLTVNPNDLADLPWLARSWKVETVKDPGGPRTRLTFVLRKDVSWQDGSSFTAKDVKATLLFLQKNAIPRYFDSVRDIASVSVPDAQTLVVTMKNVSYWHLHSIGGTPIFPAALLDRVRDWRSWQPARNPVPGKAGLTELYGTGPFVFREVRPGDYVRFSRNERFWLIPR
jgi:peptide/nickel transport system substrate-binding protein